GSLAASFRAMSIRSRTRFAPRVTSLAASFCATSLLSRVTSLAHSFCATSSCAGDRSLRLRRLHESSSRKETWRFFHDDLWQRSRDIDDRLLRLRSLQERSSRKEAWRFATATCGVLPRRRVAFCHSDMWRFATTTRGVPATATRDETPEGERVDEGRGERSFQRRWNVLRAGNIV